MALRWATGAPEADCVKLRRSEQAPSGHSMTLHAGLLVCRPMSLLASFAAVCYDLAPGTKLQIVPFATVAAKEGFPVHKVETLTFLYF